MDLGDIVKALIAAVLTLLIITLIVLLLMWFINRVYNFLGVFELMNSLVGG